MLNKSKIAIGVATVLIVGAALALLTPFLMNGDGKSNGFELWVCEHNRFTNSLFVFFEILILIYHRRSYVLNSSLRNIARYRYRRFGRDTVAKSHHFPYTSRSLPLHNTFWRFEYGIRHKRARKRSDYGRRNALLLAPQDLVLRFVCCGNPVRHPRLGSLSKLRQIWFCGCDSSRFGSDFSNYSHHPHLQKKSNRGYNLLCRDDFLLYNFSGVHYKVMHRYYESQKAYKKRLRDGSRFCYYDECPN